MHVNIQEGGLRGVGGGKGAYSGNGDLPVCIGEVIDSPRPVKSKE